MGLLFSTVRSTGKPVRWSTACWKRWTGGGTKTIPLEPAGLDGTRPGWGIQFWTLDNLRVNQNAVFLDVPVLKGFSDNFAERCIDSSLCWEHFRQRTWNCEYTSQRGGRREEAPMLFKGCNQSSFWLLNCELWPYIIFFFFFWLIFEDTCGWKSAFLVNKLFIYYSQKSSIYYQNVPFFLCWPF